MRITVDPDTSSSGFGYAEPGRYRLRLDSAEQKEGPNAPYIQWKISFSDPNIQAAGASEAKKVGQIFENTTLKKGENSQFRLKQLCDALGVVWGDFDTESVIGREFEAEVDLDDYKGTIKNVIKKYIPVGK